MHDAWQSVHTTLTVLTNVCAGDAHILLDKYVNTECSPWICFVIRSDVDIPDLSPIKTEHQKLTAYYDRLKHHQARIQLQLLQYLPPALL